MSQSSVGDSGDNMSREDPRPAPVEKYDAFISYRRESGAAEARLIRSELRERKVRAFLDVDDLKSGHFDEALLGRIAGAPNFIVILSPNALDRCSDERDWLRREIVQALKTQRNIIPVLLRGFRFPDRETLPEDLRTLSSHNGVEYSHNYFSATIAAILSFLRTPDSLKQDSESAHPSPETQTRADRSDRIKIEPSIPDLTFREIVANPALLEGRTVGRYLVKQLVGSGGSGFVYRALHPSLGQDLCVKVFYPLTSEGADAAWIVARGVRGLAAMNQTHIIKIFDFERFALDDASSFYLVMELVRGKPLDEWSLALSDVDAAFEVRLQMALDITTALAAAHSCRYIDEVGFERTGVLHGDIKPGNVMVRNDNSPVVLDFMMLDVQRLLDPRIVPPALLRAKEAQPITAAYGTPGFMAPEQDRDGIVTIRSDIYGLGMTLAHLFFPNSGNPLLELYDMHPEDRLTGLRTLLRAMLEEDPDARPRDMEEVARLLVSHTAPPRVNHAADNVNAAGAAMKRTPVEERAALIDHSSSEEQTSARSISTTETRKADLSPAPVVDAKLVTPARAELQKSGGKALVVVAGLVISAFAGLIGYRFLASLLALIISQVAGLSLAKSNQLLAVLGPICGLGSMALVFIIYVIRFWKGDGKKK